jgi:curved DNA-binding protein CbpA
MAASNGRRYYRPALVQDYYQVLDVPRSASFGQIKDAYWRQAFRAESGEGLALLNEAYEILGSEEQRGAYDAELGSGRAEP